MGADASKVSEQLNDSISKKKDAVGATFNQWKRKTGLQYKLGDYPSSSEYDSSEEEDFPDTPDSGEDPAARGAQMEDRFYNNKSFQKPGIDSNDPSQREAALEIQTRYRQFHAKQEVEAKRKEKAVVKMQAGFRGWEDRKKVDEMKKGSDGAAGSLDEEEVDIDLNDPEVAAAATKIQAGFKGHKARQEVKKRQEDKKAKEDDLCSAQADSKPGPAPEPTHESAPEPQTEALPVTSHPSVTETKTPQADAQAENA